MRGSTHNSQPVHVPHRILIPLLVRVLQVCDGAEQPPCALRITQWPSNADELIVMETTESVRFQSHVTVVSQKESVVWVVYVVHKAAVI